MWSTSRADHSGGAELRRPGRLVIDASLDKRLAFQLDQRGRNARSAEWLGLTHAKDPPLLRALRDQHPECVLVTGDDDMPGEHGELIERLGLTIATIDGYVATGWGPAEWKREIVHRWAHVMETQPAHARPPLQPRAIRPLDASETTRR
jgi:hypothetical protein